ncbi:MAG: M20/M25/M40 family metallo-hydrolase [Bacteroidetes bacterium]|nr:M20/M25/M40 family metallo-hydrolase [Bacteroidota bacterium]
MKTPDTYSYPARLAARLIDIPSVTGSEAAMLLSLEEQCEQMGLITEREQVSRDRWNLYAGWQTHTDVLFCTHVDTVPPFFPARFEGEILYGRGACDTKGIIAAMLVAGGRLIESGYDPAFLFVVGEETDSIGAQTAARGERSADFIIVGEPTDNMLASGHKGVLSYTLSTEGIAVHSAYPERGISAIHALLDLLSDIRYTDWGSSPLLGSATTNIGLIEGGVAMNTLAPNASATVVHRIVDDTESRKAQLLHLIDGRASVRFQSISEPQILTTVTGFPTKPVSFGTDIPYLSSMGNCLLFGPGSIHDAHREDEKIRISEIEYAVDAFVSLYHALRKK